MSGPTIFKAPFGASHGNGHSLVAVTGMSHGYTSREMLPHVMRFNYSHCKPQLTRIASALGGDDGGDAADAISALILSLGHPPVCATLACARTSWGKLPLAR